MGIIGGLGRSKELREDSGRTWARGQLGHPKVGIGGLLGVTGMVGWWGVTEEVASKMSLLLKLSLPLKVQELSGTLRGTQVMIVE